MKLANLIFGAITWMTGSSLVFAQSYDIKQQREWFETAKSQAANGSYTTVENWREKLGDYPLFPYIEQAYLKNHAFLSNKEKIRSFLSLYEGTPLEWPLRETWLKYLAKQNQPLLYINDFKPTSNAELNCHYLSAELEIGAKIATLADKIEDLWVVGKSQPKACDPLFAKWKKAGYQTSDVIKRRVEKAADGGSHTLIPYLTGLLPESEKDWAKLWHSVRKDPAVITQLKHFKKRSADYAGIQFYGIKRFIWRDPDAAIKHWLSVEESFPFTAEQRDKVYYTFALALASKDHPQAITWLNKVPDHVKDSKLVHWHLATYLREQDWVNVASVIQSLPQNMQDEAIYQYWLSRAQTELGIEQTAKTRFTELSKLRHYYGFMAAAQIGEPYQLNYKPYKAEQEVLHKLSNAPAAKRTYEFLQLDYKVSARREWWQFKRTLSENELAAAAYLAYQWQWYDQALRGISQAGLYDEVAIRFPKAFADLYEKYSQRVGIEPSLAFAISRRESSFMEDAYSPAGARGLMQLMPATAKHVEGSRVSNRRLYDAQTNIRLGTKYISSLIKRMQQQTPLAIASYNAGYSRVITWLPEEKALPLDIWIENIPYSETREYVKAVLAYQQVYELMSNQPKNVFSDLVKTQIVKNN
ncbi:transglycosylase SLT domain-containing protein [Catenovulum sp. 2E275]|uniref:transglycosylase SLT domain-containing protein n=1 Tax=Catenovulum sp. 2E275 TaxID=2980497 RepID=UPI0021D030F6|nr:transglycosylase SLT domain-containing protein [Catenovulum sp. 2E275]MCU4676585.1 transglycosylase SLT domain-containing protein [Catenovulum sp. 2E275]